MLMLTLTITDEEIDALERATWHAHFSGTPNKHGSGLVSLLRKISPASPALAELDRIARNATTRTTSELLAEHSREIDAELVRRWASPEVVGGGSL